MQHLSWNVDSPKFQLPAGATFAVLAERIFDLVTSCPSRQLVDVVFDVYFDVSIKNAERCKRSSTPEGVRYKNILPGYPIKSWKKILSIQSNKTEVVNFIVSEWKKPQFTFRLGSKVMFVTQGSKCWKLTATCSSAVPELECNHEEADTRMVLHAKYSNSLVVIHADGTANLLIWDHLYEDRQRIKSKNYTA